jgi:hypothetical protein
VSESTNSPTSAERPISSGKIEKNVEYEITEARLEHSSSPNSLMVLRSRVTILIALPR